MANATHPDLGQKMVLITGGATGIGEALVRAFVGQGARVGFLDIDATAGDRLAVELGSVVHFGAVDLRDTAAL